MGRVMHPRLVLSTPAAVDGRGHIAIPRTVDGTRLWDTRFPIKVGDLDGWEYRTTDDQLFVVARIGATGGRVLALLFVPTAEEGDDTTDARGLRAALATLVARQWRIGADRSLVAELEADGGALATAVKAAWPAEWRRREPTDEPEQPASGPRVLGVSLGTVTGARAGVRNGGARLAPDIAPRRDR